MQEDWEINWGDYYEILQVHPSAEPEVIQAAYRKLVQKYHPDINNDGAAAERMKKINVAYEVLSNPEKRKQYDFKYFQKEGTAGSSFPKPKPVVEPSYIHFKDVEPRQTQTASFIVRNAGGPYTKIWISNPDSWVRITRYSSLADDELPLRVEIEAEGDDWGQGYSEIITVMLDGEEAQVKVGLETKSAPAGRKTTAGPGPKAGYTYNPPPATPKHGIPGWSGWLIGLVVIFGAVIAFGQLWSPDTSPKTAVSPTTPTASELKAQQIKESLKNWHEKNMPPDSRYDLDDYAVVGEHIWALMGRSWMPGLGYIIHSGDDGNSWEIQWEKERTSLGSINFLNESEGIVSIERNTLIKTSDGGKTWNEFFTLRHMPGVSIWWIESFEIGDGQNMTLETTADSRAFVTKDGGKTWEIREWYLQGSGSGVLRTSNGGETWYWQKE